MTKGMHAAWREGQMDERRARMVWKRERVCPVLELNLAYHTVVLDIDGAACSVPFHEVQLLSKPEYLYYRKQEETRVRPAPKPAEVAA